MINFSLICDSEHEFEGWFRDSAAFDEQVAAGEIACPHCGSTKVTKGLMAPNIGAKSNKRVTAAAASPGATEMAEALRKMREYVRDNADYVGESFPEEARKIHYEESEARGIYGEASADEVRDLTEEGIDVLPMPVLPEDSN